MAWDMTYFYGQRDAASDIIIPDNTTPTVSDKPEHLYAYTDPNPSSETLYGWTYEDCTVYTKSTTPSSGDRYYNENGTDITGSLVVNGDKYGNCMIDYYSNNTIRIYVEPA